MGLIKEPLNIDFYTTGRQMTDEDQKRVSDYIRKKKALKNKNIERKENTTVKTETLFAKKGI
jgi:hypothetical protein